MLHLLLKIKFSKEHYTIYLVGGTCVHIKKLTLPSFQTNLANDSINLKLQLQAGMEHIRSPIIDAFYRTFGNRIAMRLLQDVFIYLVLINKSAWIEEKGQCNQL